MKTTVLLFSLLTLAPAIAVTASAKDATSRAAPAPTALQVSVDVPVSMRPWLDDDVSEAFGVRVSDALSQQGFKGPIKYLRIADKPSADVPLLEVSLIEWRVDPIGMVDCTFTASLTTSKGTKDMGLFTGTGLMVISRRDWFSLSDQFDEAAQSAMHDLYRHILATELLPAGDTGPKVSA